MSEQDKGNEFLAQSRISRPTLARELWDFVKHNKKWWLLPILALLLLMGVLVFLSSTGLSPWIYTFF